MATHTSILAWNIPWTKKPPRLQSVGPQSRTRLSNFTSLHFTYKEAVFSPVVNCPQSKVWTNIQQSPKKKKSVCHKQQLRESPGKGWRPEGRSLHWPKVGFRQFTNVPAVKLEWIPNIVFYPRYKFDKKGEGIIPLRKQNERKHEQLLAPMWIVQSTQRYQPTRRRRNYHWWRLTNRWFLETEHYLYSWA